LPAVRSLVEQHGIAEHCTVTGFLGSPEKFEALADADVFALPSYSENFANALFEALACGAPAVISNRVNSWPEVAEAGAATVVDTNIDDLAGAIRELLSSGERRDKLSQNARDFTRQNYDWSIIARKLELEYLSLAEAVPA